MWRFGCLGGRKKTKCEIFANKNTLENKAFPLLLLRLNRRNGVMRGVARGDIIIDATIPKEYD